MRFDLITIFPEQCHSAMSYGIVGRALQKHIAQFYVWNPRDYTQNNHRTVDDRPYGGGPGMVMKMVPLCNTILAAKQAAPKSTVIYLSPQGRLLEQVHVQDFAQRPGLILVAGRYEGVDERVLTCCIDEEWSIGDYVLSGGELPALVLMDAIIRLLPGALGHADSAQQDSHSQGLLDCPHYTRPESIMGLNVPQVLLHGHHQEIRRWRLQQSLLRTWQRRPDLLRRRVLSQEEQLLLDEILTKLHERI